MHISIRFAGASLLTALTLIPLGCGSTRSANVHPSGFLADYSGMKPASGGEETLVYVSREGALGDYDRFMIDPVLIYFHPESNAHAVNPEELSALAASLRHEVVAQLEDGHYAIVEEPGPGVLRIRTAITDVDPASPAANVAPKVAAVATVGMGFLVPSVDVGRASIECEMLDAHTGQRIVAFADAKKGKRFLGTFTAAQKWGHAHAAFKNWAKQFRQRLDETRAER